MLSIHWIPLSLTLLLPLLMLVMYLCDRNRKKRTNSLDLLDPLLRDAILQDDDFDSFDQRIRADTNDSVNDDILVVEDMGENEEEGRVVEI
mmetsp:Transcript_18034/g.33515  ORF Transcript_18034/g.33515 Transcript_18034/m.33515 type:complete len:91 (+) Transcript_18034:260-532(+)